MSETQIFVYPTAAEADEGFVFWRNIAGVKVIMISPSDVVSMRGGAPDLIRWESGDGKDWHIIIVTDARRIVTDTAIPVAG